MRTWRKTIAGFVSAALVCLMILPAISLPAEASSSPAPKSFMQIWDKIKSKNGVDPMDLNYFDVKAEDEKEESVPTYLSTLSKSMWYVESEDLVRSVVTVYDNHGAIKHYREQVILTVKEIGQGDRKSTRLNSSH